GQREVGVSLIRADRAAMIDRENLNREMHENREIGKSPLCTSTPTRGGEEMALAVSSQVMVWLVMNTATEIPSRRSCRRKVDYFSIPARRAALS
ncbi:MAG: hypothetical protein J0M26_03135, partial [Planctomycetes bacterium]|nr:hypothetical protein [Planctomycetota bacterium]